MTTSLTGTIRIDINKGTVKQDLAMLPEKMLEAAYEELVQQAHLMQGIAQILVRVDTGSLRDSIRVERVGPTYHLHMMVKVRAGGYVTNPKTGRRVHYAGFVEALYPYMQPAWDEIKDNVAALIERKVVEAVK